MTEMAVDPYSGLLGMAPAVPLLAAAAAQAQARVPVQVAAQAASIKQWMDLNQQVLDTESAVNTSDQPFLPPGMTLRLAAAGLTPPVAALPHVQGSAAGGFAPVAKVSVANPSAPGRGGVQAAPAAAALRAKGSQGNHGSAQGSSGKGKETLRTYLQELQGLDQRCAFITRRINKLGFRSKLMLEQHFSQYGEVVRVLVAHSKVKQFPDLGTRVRVRPGNFGLVVMKSPEAVNRILAQGPDQIVMGTEIHVHHFEQVSMQKEIAQEKVEAQSWASDEIAAANKTEWKTDSLMSGSTYSGGEVGIENPGSGGMQQQFTPNSDISGAGDSSRVDGSGGDDRMALAPEAGEGPESAHGDRTPWPRRGPSMTSGSTTHDKVSVGSDRSSQGSSSSSLPPHSAPAKQRQEEAPPAEAPPSVREDMEQPGRNPRSSSLAVALGELVRMAKEYEQMDSFTQEQSIAAASLAQWAQQSLKRLEEECQQKIAELVSPVWPAASPPVRPAPGLAPPSLDVAGNVAAVAAAAAAMQGMPPGLPAPQLPYGWLAPQPPIAALPQVAPVLPPAAVRAFPYLNAMALSFLPQAHIGIGALMTSPSAHDLTAANLRAAAVAAPQPEQTHFNRREAPEQRRPGDDCGSRGRKDNSFGHSTLREHLTELCGEDPRCIFITRRINKLGFRSKEILKLHFSKYGEVSCVRVAHSKVKLFCDDGGKLRTRPGGLGLIVMRNASSVAKILSLGEEQIVAGHQVQVQCFERPKVDEATSSTMTTTASKSRRARMSDGSGTPSPNKSEEGGSSEPYGKSDGDVKSSGPDAPESPQSSFR